MKLRISLITMALIFIALVVTGISFAEDADIVHGGAYPQEKNESQMQWAWGEVTVVDPASGTLTVKYFDYDAGQDKELNVTVDEKTAYENISKIDDLKPGQNVSVDYSVLAEGKNIARNISLEKAEDTGTQTKTEEVAPAKTEETAAPAVKTEEPASMENTETGTVNPAGMTTATQENTTVAVQTSAAIVPEATAQVNTTAAPEINATVALPANTTVSSP
ncbi:MAG: DUF5666 domain-containing protein [Candidatus Omnitrophota bacterium]